MLRTLCLTSILLAGCATTDGLEHGNAVPQQTLVTVPCLTKAEIPIVPQTHVKPGMAHDQIAAAALADEADLEGYAVKADGKLHACAGDTNGPSLH